VTKTENLKKQLIDISDAVNAFQSDAVQVIVVERVLDHLIDHAHKSSVKEQTSTDLEVSGSAQPRLKISEKTAREPKIPGTTKLLQGLINSQFFSLPKYIGEVTDYFNDNYKGPFYTYQISGLLLGLYKSGKLRREVNAETKRYVYLNA
jgi:hypothetical protein